MELNRTSSEVALTESHKKSYRPSFNCCFGWSTFQSSVLLGLILLHVVLIVILLPLVSSSIVRLDEIADRVDAINNKVDAIDGKIMRLEEAQMPSLQHICKHLLHPSTRLQKSSKWKSENNWIKPIVNHCHWFLLRSNYYCIDLFRIL